MSRIAIVGAGSWGTAIAVVLARRGGHSIALWSHNARAAETMVRTRENSPYLPGIRIPGSVQVFTNIHQALMDAEIIVAVVPSEHMRTVCQDMAPWLGRGQIVVSASKGIEDGTHLRMTQVIGEVLHGCGIELPCAVISGPSFAQEVGFGSPTAITVASTNPAIATQVQDAFAGPTLRLYTNPDVVGVEFGGSLKNVIAIAAGVTAGLGLGQNSIAALITRGIAEITRLAVACGGQPETLAGLSGLGDLVLTCTGTLSRNRHVGVELGKNHKLSDILAGMAGKVAEGVRTTHAALGLARQYGVEMPITDQVAALLSEQILAPDAMHALMSRPWRDE